MNKKFLLYGALFITAELSAASKSVLLENNLKLGSFAKTEKRIAVFTIKNEGDENLLVTRIGKSCGCASAEMSLKSIAPQKTATLTVTVEGKELDGEFDKSVFLVTNDPVSMITQCKFSGTVDTTETAIRAK